MMKGAGAEKICVSPFCVSMENLETSEKIFLLNI